jgi:hypothetical protein
MLSLGFFSFPKIQRKLRRSEIQKITNNREYKESSSSSYNL